MYMRPPPRTAPRSDDIDMVVVVEGAEGFGRRGQSASKAVLKAKRGGGPTNSRNDFLNDLS